MDAIGLSFVVPVYNKADSLPFTIQALLDQKNVEDVEYIFVDDASTDHSVAVIEETTKDVDNVILIRNQENKGPSVRLNQGCRIAQGTYLHLLDADDIIPDNASTFMIDALKKYEADFIYGKWCKTTFSAHQLLGRSIQKRPRIIPFSNPLKAVLSGKFVRMTLMVKRNLYQKAQGCDERVFIQDESLPLRLAYHAKKFVATDAVVVLVPEGAVGLSKNKEQQQYDRFFVYKYALEEFTQVDNAVRIALYRRAVSAVWKMKRTQKGVLQKGIFFSYYIWVKIFPVFPNRKKLRHMAQYMSMVHHVRKMPG